MSRDLFSFLGDETHEQINGSLPAQRDHVELDLVLHYDNSARGAILVSETGEESSAVWLAKSQIQVNRSGKKVPAVKRDGQREVLPVITVSIPEWLAKSKGLI